jgi:hypothetical protein
LNAGALSSRKVELVDISSNAKDYWSYVVGGPEIDLSKFKSQKTGRGLLSHGWQVCNGSQLCTESDLFHFILCGSDDLIFSILCVK